MFTLFKKKAAPAQVKYVDWTRVRTVADIVSIMSRLNVSIAVGSDAWAELNHLLKDDIKGE